MDFRTIFLCGVKVLVQDWCSWYIFISSSVFRVSFCTTNGASFFLAHSKLLDMVLSPEVGHHPVHRLCWAASYCLCQSVPMVCSLSRNSCALCLGVSGPSQYTLLLSPNTRLLPPVWFVLPQQTPSGLVSPENIITSPPIFPLTED